MSAAIELCLLSYMFKLCKPLGMLHKFNISFLLSYYVCIEKLKASMFNT